MEDNMLRQLCVSQASDNLRRLDTTPISAEDVIKYADILYRYIKDASDTKPPLKQVA